MAFGVFSPRPQLPLLYGRLSRSFRLDEKTSEEWERQRGKPLVRKYRQIRSMLLHGKSNACVDSFGQDAPPGRRCVIRQKQRGATNPTSNGRLEAYRSLFGNYTYQPGGF